MSMLILEECISCGACEPECPSSAITAGDSIYVIDAALCTECEGVHDTPQCITICPVEGCIVPATA
jgi:ferredoxin